MKELNSSDGVCIRKEADRRLVEREEGCEVKTLYFEGAGWSGADISKATIGNCRIRTVFHLDDGRRVYLEIIGNERTKYSTPLCQWQYTGFVTDCFYITDDKPNDDCNKHSIQLTDRRRVFEYTEKNIMELVNSFGASFDAVKVVPDLGGYRVFPEDRSCGGPYGYNYGDEFQYNYEMTARREAVEKFVYDMELAELKEDRANGEKRFVHSSSRSDFPNFSLWVDRNDPGLLHLLRHFRGYNKHWTIRTDVGEALEDWLETMRESYLGRYGC